MFIVLYYFIFIHIIHYVQNNKRMLIFYFYVLFENINLLIQFISYKNIFCDYWSKNFLSRDNLKNTLLEFFSQKHRIFHDSSFLTLAQLLNSLTQRIKKFKIFLFFNLNNRNILLFHNGCLSVTIILSITIIPNLYLIDILLIKLSRLKIKNWKIKMKNCEKRKKKFFFFFKNYISP